MSVTSVTSLGWQALSAFVCYIRYIRYIRYIHCVPRQVYDFSVFANKAACNNGPAGIMPIKDVAMREGSGILNVTAIGQLSVTGQRGNDCGSWDRWHQRGPAFAKYGDVVTMADLPFSVQSPGFAAAVGVTLVPAATQPIQEICGSFGEVANNPLLDNAYPYGGYRRNQVYLYDQQDLSNTYRTHNEMKSNLHATISVYAPDQLRQRMAWSLSQVCVIGAVGAGGVLGDATEQWTHYYDIFVRHAFGSYFNILKEGARAAPCPMEPLDGTARQNRPTDPPLLLPR